MIPRIHAKFRKRYGIPFAIEQLSGRQFRCRHCNEVFFTEKEMDRHIKSVVRFDDKNKFRVNLSSPKLSSNIFVKVFYAYDLTDKIKRQWLKLKKGDEYDGH
jgi:hypothetical protein